jgi:chloramphenicol-sensitive protein RarD
VILAGNWFIFIWAVHQGHVLQTSLGYFINPLVSVLLGMIILKERLRPMQSLALITAGIGVLYLTIQYGKIPWIALSLALTFGFYGLVRKTAPASALVGLSFEMLLLSCPALVYLLYLGSKGEGAFLRVTAGTDLLLMTSALFTALPLLLFTAGARRLRLSTLGFLQYIIPTCFFFLAIFYFDEPIDGAQIFAFILIWAALCIYTTDSTIHYRRIGHLLSVNKGD